MFEVCFDRKIPEFLRKFQYVVTHPVVSLPIRRRFLSVTYTFPRAVSLLGLTWKISALDHRNRNDLLLTSCILPTPRFAQR